MPSTLGQIKGWGNVARSICIMAPATANVAAPSTATAGIPVYSDPRKIDQDGHAFPNTPPRVSTLVISGTATASEVLVGTFTLWGYHPGLAKWIEIPTAGGTAVTPVALAETDTDVITHRERYEDLGHFSRLALQLAAIGGAGASFEAWLTTALENS